MCSGSRLPALQRSRRVEKVRVEIVDAIATYDYGKFVHNMDPEGNKIELWEPVDSVFTKCTKAKPHTESCSSYYPHILQ